MALTLRDKTLLDMAANNATPKMIAEKTGFPESKVALELDRLLGTMDWLSEMQRLKLLLESHYRLKEHLEEEAMKHGDEKAATNLIRLLRDMADLLDRISTRADASIEKVQNAHAKTMMAIVEASFYKSIATLKKKFPELDEAEVEEEFQFNLMEIAAKYDSDDK